jgi:uncharacterized membrane protein
MRFWKQTVLFYLGGGSYVSLELLWRGRSHGSMFFLGGACFLLIGNLCRLLYRCGVLLKALVGAVVITVMELLAGLAVNRDHSVWDYRRLPLNFRGQISLLYFLLWIPVSLLGIFLFRGAQRSLDKKENIFRIPQKIHD